MTSPGFTILHATDLLPDADSVAQEAFSLAKKSKAQLITLHVTTEEAAKPGTQTVIDLLAKASPEINHSLVVRKVEETPKKGLLQNLENFDPDLLVVGTRQQKKPKKDFRASVAEVVALDAKIPTLVLHIGQQGLLDEAKNLRIRRVLLPIGDGVEGRDAIKGLTRFLTTMEINDVDLFLFRVGEGEVLEYLSLPTKKGWRWHKEVQQGTLAEAIGTAVEQKEIDLVAMSTRGQDGFIDVFSGTHTQKVIRRVSCPVLVSPVFDEKID